MGDIFDEVAASGSDAPETDIFDEVAAESKGDVFDEVEADENDVGFVSRNAQAFVQGLKKLAGGTLQSLGEPRQGGVVDVAYRLAKQAGRTPEETRAELLNNPLTVKGRLMAAAADKALIDLTPKNQGALAQLADGVTQSLALGIPLVVASSVAKSAAPALIGGFIAQYGQSYATKRAGGIDVEGASIGATVDASAEALGEGVSIMSLLKPGTTLGKRFLSYVAKEAPGEMATQIVQDITSKLQENPNLTYAEMAVNAAAAGATAIIASPVMAGVAHITNKPAKTTVTEDELVAAEAAPEVPDVAGQRVNTSMRTALDAAKQHLPPEVFTQLIEAQRGQEAHTTEMETLALTDPKTGAKSFTAWQRGEASKQSSVTVTDLDGLKAVNDTFGYDAGDAILKGYVESQMQAGLDPHRNSSGSDELLHGTNETDTAAHQGKLTAANEHLAATEFTFTDKQGRQVTLKGVTFSHGTGTTTDEAANALGKSKERAVASGDRSAERGALSPRLTVTVGETRAQGTVDGNAQTPAAEPVTPAPDLAAKAKPVAPDSAFNGDSLKSLADIFNSAQYNGAAFHLSNRGFTPEEITGLEKDGLATNGRMSPDQFRAYDTEYSRRSKAKGEAATKAAAERKAAVKPAVKPPVKVSAKPSKVKGPALAPELTKGGSFKHRGIRHRLNFETDLDRAAYVATQGETNAKNKPYLDFVVKQTGFSEKAVKNHGKAVRSWLAQQGDNLLNSSVIRVPDLMGPVNQGVVQQKAEAAPAAPKAPTFMPGNRVVHADLGPGEITSNSRDGLSWVPDKQQPGKFGSKQLDEKDIKAGKVTLEPEPASFEGAKPEVPAEDTSFDPSTADPVVEDTSDGTYRDGDIITAIHGIEQAAAEASKAASSNAKNPQPYVVGKPARLKDNRANEFSYATVKAVSGSLSLQPSSSDFTNRVIVIEDQDGAMRTMDIGSRTGASGFSSKEAILDGGARHPLTHTFEISGENARRVFVFDKDRAYGNKISVYNITPLAPEDTSFDPSTFGPSTAGSAESPLRTLPEKIEAAKLDKSIGNPVLANIGQTEDVRRLIDVVDAIRGKTEKISFEEMEADGRARMEADEAGTTHRLFTEGARDGGDIMAQRALINTLGSKAFATGVNDDFVSAGIATIAYRDQQSEIGRMLAAGRDMQKGPAQRMREHGLEAVIRPDVKSEKDLRKIDGQTKQEIADIDNTAEKEKAKAAGKAAQAGSQVLKRPVSDESLRKQYEAAASKSIQAAMKTADPKAKVLLQGLYDQIVSALKAQVVQPKTATEPKASAIDGMRDLIANDDKLKSVWEKTKAEILAKRPDLADTLNKIEATPFTDANILAAAREADIKLRDLVGKHFSEANTKQAGETLSKKITAELGLSPEKAAELAKTIEATFARLVNAANEKATAARKKARDNALAKKKKALLRNGHPEQVKRIRDALLRLGLDITNMSDADLLNKDKMAMFFRIASTEKSTAFAKALEFWKGGLITAPSTSIANMIGNTGSVGWDFTIQRMVEATINLGVNDPNQAQIGELPYLWRGLLPSTFKEAWGNAKTAWSREAPVFAEEVGLDFDGLNKTEYVQAKGKLESNAAIPGTFGRVARRGFRALLAQDEFGKTMAYRGEVAAQAYRIAKRDEPAITGDRLAERIQEQVTDPKSEASIRAYTHVLKLLFQNDVGPIADAVMMAREKVPAMNFLVPFIATPTNIIKTGARKSVLGSVPLAFGLAKEATMGYRIEKHESGLTIRKNGEMIYDRSKLVPHVAEQALAWGVMMAVMAAISGDDDGPFLTGTAASFTERGKKDFQERHQPAQSWRMPGGSYHSFARFQPFSTALTLMIDLANGVRDVKNGQDIGVATNEFMKHAMGLVRDMPFLQGIGDMIRAWEAPDKVGQWFSNFGASWVSNDIRQAAGATDDLRRNYGVYGRGTEWLGNLAIRTGQKALPIAAIAPAPKVDLLGREMRKDDHGGAATNFIYRMLVPSIEQDVDHNKIDDLVTNWNLKSIDDQFFPAAPKREFTVRGKKVQMTEDEYTGYLKESGAIALKRIETKTLDVENPKPRDIRRINKAIENARKRVRRKIIGDYKLRTRAK